VIESKSGPIQGTVETSREGRSFYAFRGIPYAAPPMGELRFKVSQLIVVGSPPVDNREGELRLTFRKILDHQQKQVFTCLTSFYDNSLQSR
jgi:carboxylesterase type B